jgi:hypothetical protein
VAGDPTLCKFVWGIQLEIKIPKGKRYLSRIVYITGDRNVLQWLVMVTWYSDTFDELGEAQRFLCKPDGQGS